jgi:hypothetical protein
MNGVSEDSYTKFTNKRKTRWGCKKEIQYANLNAPIVGKNVLET